MILAIICDDTRRTDTHTHTVEVCVKVCCCSVTWIKNVMAVFENKLLINMAFSYTMRERVSEWGWGLPYKDIFQVKLQKVCCISWLTVIYLTMWRYNHVWIICEPACTWDLNDFFLGIISKESVMRIIENTTNILSSVICVSAVWY